MAEGRYVLSFGGGVNSVALMVLLVRESAPLDVALFADTGGETPETYAYLDIAEEWLRNRAIPLIRVKKKGRTLYETAWERRVIPSAVWRWSTRDYKVGPILRYYRTLGAPVTQYLAIAFDEIERMKDSRVSYVVNRFPLVERRMTRSDCAALIRDAGLPIPARSACYFCPFNSIERWKWVHDSHPILFAKSVALEENSKHYPTQRLTDQALRHQSRMPTKLSLRELGEIFDKGDPLPLIPSVGPQPCGADCMT